MYPIKLPLFVHSIYLHLVLHAFRPQDKFGIASYREGLGLHSPDLPRCIFIQVFCMWCSCSHKRFQMARGRSNRVPHELQRVCVVINISKRRPPVLIWLTNLLGWLS